MERAIEARVKRAIGARVFPGCVVGVVKRSGERKIMPFGHTTYEPNAPRVKEDTVYDIASITKSIPTGSLALMLLEQGKVSLTDRLIDYVPLFNNSDRETVRIKHLLTYTLDGYGLASLKKESARALFHALYTHDFEKRPGTIFKYTNIPATLLGLVIERVSNRPLDVLADEELFTPLGMKRTTFSPELLPLQDIAPTEIDDWRGLGHGVVHDESAYIARRDGVTVGHAGLFSTAGDLLNFMEMLLRGGTWNGRSFFSKESLAQMTTNQIPELCECTGLGWELNQPQFMGRGCSKSTIGKTGFTGTLCVCDMSQGVAYVILSNRTYPRRPADSSAIHALRADLGEVILRSVTE